LRPKRDLGKGLEDEIKDFSLILVRKRSDPCCDERINKFHDFS
jgi:hypothetical protein